MYSQLCAIGVGDKEALLAIDLLAQASAFQYENVSMSPIYHIPLVI